MTASAGGRGGNLGGGAPQESPTIVVRKSEERGRANHGWLDARHSFSFAGYWDPDHMGFRSLRVINEDRVRAGQGFPTHPHRDMEILTVVLEGQLEHKDSLGNGSVIRPGELQRMSAGSGIQHSEFNPSSDESLHLLQIWITPGEQGLPPGYEQKAFEFPAGELVLIASPDAADGSLTIHQDARVYRASLKTGQRIEHPLAAGRGAWIQVAAGRIRVGERELGPGDAARIEDLDTITLVGRDDEGDLILFDLA